MSEDPEDVPPRPPSSSPTGDDRDERIATLELPPFDGPLVAFDPTPEGASGGPVYLGGDLHRVRPDAAGQWPGRHRDESLDEARIALNEPGQGNLVEVGAVQGVWCLAVYGEHVDSASYLTLWDTEGRMRAWLLLPPARTMIGLAYLWLPSVPPPPGVL